MDDVEKHYTTLEVAELLRIHPRTLERWRAAGEGPQFVLLGGLVRYPASAVSSFLEARTVATKAGVAS